MDLDHPKYFDYLDEYSQVLYERFHIKKLVPKIKTWRKQGFGDPEGVSVGCRNFSQRMIHALIGGREVSSKMSEPKAVEYAERNGLISSYARERYDEIRDYGDNGAHEDTNYIYARKSLISFDQILREYIQREGINAKIPLEVEPEEDSMFIGVTEEELQEVAKGGKDAADLIKDASYGEKIEKDVEKIRNSEAKQADSIKELEGITDRLFELKEKIGPSEEIEKNIKETNAMLKEEADKAEDTEADFVQLKNEIRQILSEEDTIRMLLDGNGEATKEQLRVLAFPKGSNATSNILNIAGDAGTGKTLCLLAKLMKEIKDDIEANKQLNMFGQAPKRALFVCYNKNLGKYIRDLLQSKALKEEYPGVKERIDVIHFDRLISQLARPYTKYEYGDCAHDVRYPDGYKLYYGTDILEQSMDKISTLNSDKVSMNYLDKEKPGNVGWMNDEIKQLEAHYEDPDEAQGAYLEKRGWSNAGRRPNEKVRQLILDVWKAYRDLLDENHKFTLEQAIKRLMESNELPKYDFIAIDEAQDFNLSHIRFLWKLRVLQEGPQMYIAGDDKQRIYKRNFRWRDIEDGAAGYTITLNENKRNSPSIEKFANRLHQKASTKEECSEGIEVTKKSLPEVLDCVRNISNECPDETTVLVGKPKAWCSEVEKAGLSLQNAFVLTNYGSEEQPSVDITQPGLYVMSEYTNKGLEFDNVIMANMNEVKTDEETAENLKYVNFTRARKRLYIFYEGELPELLQKYYPDFL